MHHRKKREAREKTEGWIGVCSFAGANVFILCWPPPCQILNPCTQTRHGRVWFCCSACRVSTNLLRSKPAVICSLHIHDLVFKLTFMRKEYDSNIPVGRFDSLLLRWLQCMDPISSGPPRLLHPQDLWNKQGRDRKKHEEEAPQILSLQLSPCFLQDLATLLSSTSLVCCTGSPVQVCVWGPPPPGPALN